MRVEAGNMKTDIKAAFLDLVCSRFVLHCNTVLLQKQNLFRLVKVLWTSTEANKLHLEGVLVVALEFWVNVPLLCLCKDTETCNWYLIWMLLCLLCLDYYQYVWRWFLEKCLFWSNPYRQCLEFSFFYIAKYVFVLADIEKSKKLLFNRIKGLDSFGIFWSLYGAVVHTNSTSSSCLLWLHALPLAYDISNSQTFSTYHFGSLLCVQLNLYWYCN